MVRVLWHYRQAIARNALYELRHRYASSTAGVVWNVLLPLAQILVFTFVFSELMTVRSPSLANHAYGFTIYLCAGLLPWQAFAETITRSSQSFLANATYLKRLPVPEQVFAAQDALAGFYGLCISMLLFGLVALALGHPPQPSWLQVPVVLLGMQGLAFGIGLTLGILHVYIRDIGQILPLVLMIWFWLTPIVYLEEILPAPLQALQTWNPAYPFLDPLHRILVHGEWVAPGSILAGLGIAAAACACAYGVLRGLRAELRDLL